MDYNNAMNKRSLTQIDAEGDNKDICNTKKAKLDLTVEPEPINYTSVPSLENIIIHKIAVRLWNQPDLKKKMLEHLIFSTASRNIKLNENEISYLEMEKRISENVSLLPLPALFKDELTSAVTHIRQEILNLIFDQYRKARRNCWNETICDVMRESVDSICWKVNGTIDKANTIKFHLYNKCFKNAYEEACFYCLEDHIPSLFLRLSTRRSNFYRRRSIYRSYQYHLVAYWTCFVRNKLRKVLCWIMPGDLKNLYNWDHSVYKNMFTLSVSLGNCAAAKYFWSKLTDDEKNDHVEEWICLASKNIKNRGDYMSIICFVLSEMSNKQQQNILKKYGNEFIFFLFEWPWQQFLLPTLNLMWNYLDIEVYVNILKKGNSSAGLNFKQIWYNTPMNFRKNVIKYIIGKGILTVLWDFVKNEDFKIFKLILKDASAIEKEQIMYSALEKEQFISLVHLDKFTTLDMIKEILSSECENIDLKKYVSQECGYEICINNIIYSKFETVQRFLEWAFYSHNEIDRFKVKIAERLLDDDFKIFRHGTWEGFENFVYWCFSSDEELNHFKENMSKLPKLTDIIKVFIFDRCYLKFAQQLLVFCLSSENEIHEFKINLMLSEVGMGALYASALRIHDYPHLIEMLLDWFYPFDKEVTTLLVHHLRTEYRMNFYLLNSFSSLLDSFIHGSKEPDWHKRRIQLFQILHYSPRDNSDVKSILTEMLEKVENSM